ncbi:SRPBCC family protein [Prochlorococcus sp. MIT 1307]|uniref:SRPBCC family protein n=1 Tax=Prochlorococcus sp. MIT 1307 TaxID=3096219 RepID=UPI002A74DE63|nr:SRPBCC family protein [Prochlorococcus sp. MIT 1307]
MTVVTGFGQNEQWRRNSLKSVLFLVLTLSLPIGITSSKAQSDEPVLRRIEGETTTSMIVAVPPNKAWDVLTRYESTALQMPDIQEVEIINQSNQKLQIKQTYKGPYTFGLKIKALIEIKEHPKSMLTYKLLRGDFIHTLEGNWFLIPVRKGTLIAHRIKVEPALPGFLKPLFNKHFDKNMKNSMLILRELILKSP